MKLILVVSGIALTVSSFASALTETSRILSAKAFFIQSPDSGLYQSLDLKRRRINFKNADTQACAKSMTRQTETLSYTCTLKLPTHGAITKRHNQITQVVQTLFYAGQNRQVFVTLSDDTKSVNFSTQFDSAGVDLEVVKFNDDFYNIYGQAAVNVIGLAIKKGLVYEVLESSSNKTKSLSQLPKSKNPQI